MKTNSVKPTSMLGKILDGAIEAVKRPYIEKRIVRSFESAADSIDEQITDAEAKLINTREEMVASAKTGGEIGKFIQQLIECQQTIFDLKNAKKALDIETKMLLNEEVAEA